MEHTIDILRVHGFRVFTLDHQDETLTVLQLDAGEDSGPLIALSSSQAAQLREALGRTEHAALETLWDR